VGNFLRRHTDSSLAFRAVRHFRTRGAHSEVISTRKPHRRAHFSSTRKRRVWQPHEWGRVDRFSPSAAMMRRIRGCRSEQEMVVGGQRWGCTGTRVRRNGSSSVRRGTQSASFSQAAILPSPRLYLTVSGTSERRSPRRWGGGEERGRVCARLGYASCASTPRPHDVTRHCACEHEDANSPKQSAGTTTDVSVPAGSSRGGHQW
jgi:hypothetical protein